MNRGLGLGLGLGLGGNTGGGGEPVVFEELNVSDGIGGFEPLNDNVPEQIYVRSE